MGEKVMSAGYANAEMFCCIAAQIRLVKHLVPHLKKNADGTHDDFRVAGGVIISRHAIDIYFEVKKELGHDRWLLNRPVKCKDGKIYQKASKRLEKAVREFMRRTGLKWYRRKLVVWI